MSQPRHSEILPPCERPGCGATSVGMVVFQCAYRSHRHGTLDGSGALLYPTYPWQWRCTDHSHKDALERDLRPEDLEHVREQLERYQGERLPMPQVGLSNLSTVRVAELRKALTEGDAERLPKPPPVTFVSTRELEAFTGLRIECGRGEIQRAEPEPLILSSRGRA
jgi:hypothetical protein